VDLGRGFTTLMRGFRETDFDDRIIRQISAAGVPEGENVGNCCSCFGVKATISMSRPSSTIASTGTAIGRLPKPRNPPKSITTMI
jgi:hypothetical protein